MMSIKKLGTIAIAASIMAAAAAAAGYWTFKPSLERETMNELRIDIAERASRQRQLFTDISLMHEAAERSVLRRYTELGDTDVTEPFDLLFPLQPDGTRRSAPELFDGHGMGNGDSVYGMGAFIANGDRLSADDMRLLIAAYQTVRLHGEAAYGRFDNLYFYTSSNQLIIFGPQRDDRLEFYRMHAPSDFDFQGERIAQVVSPQNNPTGVVACTDLSRLIYRQDGQALTTGCHMPVRQHGRHLGAFGTTIEMQNYLANAVLDHRDGSQNVILTRDGAVIANNDLILLDELSPAAVAEATAHVGAEDIAQRIRDIGRAVGAYRDGDGRFVSYASLDAPGWYFVTLSPASGPTAKALQISFAIAFFTFWAGAAQLLVLAVSSSVVKRATKRWFSSPKGAVKILRV